MSQLLHNAILNEDFNALRELLESGADVNAKFEPEVSQQHAEMTPLALAAMMNKLAVVKLLTSYGCNVDDTFGSLNTTALMVASFHGHSKIVQYLLEEGANVNLVDSQGSTTLGYAFGGCRSIEVIGQLLKAGVDVNHPNLFGMTSLLLVAGYGNDQLVKMVLDAGAHADATNNFGHTALHLAVVGKRTQLKKLLARDSGSTQMYYNLNRRDIDVALRSWTFQHRDILTDNQCDEELNRVGQFMMMIGASLETDETSPEETEQSAMKRRVEAVWKYRQEKMQQEKTKHKSRVFDNLLTCGGKRAKQTAKLQTMAQAPLARPMTAAEMTSFDGECNSEITEMIDRYSRILRLLIDAGCRIDSMEKTFGLTSLDMAILLGDIESTAILVCAGGDHRHLMKMFAASELFDAIVTFDKKQVKKLLCYDVDLDVNQSFCKFGESQKTIVEDGHSYKYEGLTPLALAAQVTAADVLDIIKLLQRHGADVNKVGPGGSSPLAEAARIGSVKMVQFLLKEGADVELCNESYQNATAVGVAAIEKQLDVVDHLIAQGAKVDLPLSDGQTLLTRAADAGYEAVVERLLRANLEINFANKDSRFFELAEKFQRREITVSEVMNSVVNVAEQESFVTLCGIGSVSGDALLTSVIPGLTSLTVAAEPLSDNGLENRTRKKRFRKLNTNNATTDTSYQSAVAMAMTDGVLQQTLDISGISFKSASDNHVLDDNVHGRVDRGLVRTWYNQRTGFI